MAVYDIWEAEEATGDPGNSLYLRGMKLSKEFRFFTYLLESYAQYKGITAAEVLKILDEKNLTDFVFNMYEIYHTEAIENAYMDIDSLVKNGKTAW